MSQSIYPCLSYRDARGAMEWLRTALGFEERAVHEGENGSIAHAELALDGHVVMLGSVAKPGEDLLGQPAGADDLHANLVVGRHALAVRADTLADPRDPDLGLLDMDRDHPLAGIECCLERRIIRHP